MGRIRTRFAPSPTGFLHIGGLRTALFAFLFARHEGGDFILRIEDTDRARLVEGALEDIIDSLRWLKITYDEGPDIGGAYAPYLQSERREIYYIHAHELLKKGNAYRCFCSPERLSTLREEQRRQGMATGYDRQCRNLSEKECEKHDKKDEPSVIRLKIPLEGETTFKDLIRGSITKKNIELDDMVLLKSDGFPTYHLANVVDDHLMNITHVIRGDEWIPSTPRHIILYDAFGWNPPVFAHVPVILSQEGGKLSKRHGATMVREFRQKGYLSEALLNFVALLGWSYDDKTELFDREQLINYFDLERVGKSPAIFSYEKLTWFNGIYIRRKKREELYDLLLPYLIDGQLVKKDDPDENKNYIKEIIPLIQERLKYLSQIAELTWFFFDNLFEIKDKEFLIPKNLVKDDAINILLKSLSCLKGIFPFEEGEIEHALRSLTAELKLKTGQVFMILRVATTGTRVSPGLFETLRVLGKERVLKRLSDAIDLLNRVD